MGARLQAIQEAEISKGCDPTIWPQPVALEPVYTPIGTAAASNRARTGTEIVYENGIAATDRARMKVWISPKRAFEWSRCESFLKQLCSVSHRVVFEIVGNKKHISISLSCHRTDAPMVRTAFEGKIEHCMTTPIEEPVYTGLSGTLRLRDFVPLPPYHHLFTRPEELQDCPYESLMAALEKLPPETLGLYQVVFQPVSPDHNWHHNVQCLTDWEFLVKQIGNLGIVQRYAQQIPSGALHHTAGKLESKAHNDKPFYAVAMRIAVFGSSHSATDILSLSTLTNLFQHGGRPLCFLTEEDYGRVLPPQAVYKMLTDAVTYRSGFLLNSDELNGLVHVPPAGLLERWDSMLDLVDPFTAADLDLSEGVPIGIATVAGREQSICISPTIRKGHVHMVGDPGMGKSSLMESMALYDIEQGHGVAVLDPHGDLVDRLLALIPEQAVSRTIYFNPGDPDWVPLWNPMSRVPGRDSGCMTNNLIGVLKSVVKDWGDRLENILRQSIYGLNHIEHTSFLELWDLLRTGTEESKQLKNMILQVVQSEVPRQFWLYDHKDYRSDEFGPPRNKLSKLLIGGTYALMLSQPHSRFSFRRMMDDGMIFLADLSVNLGTEVCDMLGGFILATIHATALGRGDVPPEQREPFYVYLDETPRFVTDRLEKMLDEDRKFGVHLTMAHQRMRQFSRDQANALAGVGSTVVFNVGRQDAEHLAKDFLKEVRADDIRELAPQEALVRIHKNMAKIRTRDRKSIPAVNFRDEIIEQSHRKYCLPVAEVQAMIRRRHCSGETFEPLVPGDHEGAYGGRRKERLYDEF